MEILHALLIILTLVFFLSALLFRRTRIKIEKESLRNTSTLSHVRNIIDEKKR